MYEIISKSENETIEFARKLAEQLKDKAVIVLNGELGAGKTKFVQGFLKYYNLEEEISSPTFTIVNEYNSNKVNIYHFDVYRLEDEEEFYAIGGEEYFEKGICIIEWGNIIKNALPNEYIDINIKKIEENDNYRKIQIIPHGNIMKKIMEGMKK